MHKVRQPNILSEKHISTFERKLDEFDPGFVAAKAHPFGPDSALDLPDMGLAEQEHAETGLTDTAADSARKLPGKKFPVEIQVFLPFLVPDFKLECK